jgi:hypothetical protein
MTLCRAMRDRSVGASISDASPLRGDAERSATPVRVWWMAFGLLLCSRIIALVRRTPDQIEARGDTRSRLMKPSDAATVELAGKDPRCAQRDLARLIPRISARISGPEVATTSRFLCKVI